MAATTETVRGKIVETPQCRAAMVARFRCLHRLSGPPTTTVTVDAEGALSGHQVSRRRLILNRQNALVARVCTGGSGA